MIITIVQLSDKSVALAKFRYVMTLTSETYPNVKAIVAASFYDLIHRDPGPPFGQADWNEIESALAEEGVWTRKIDDPQVRDAFLRCVR